MLFGKRTAGGAEWLVVGLGNPGDKYENTRHNVGFLTVDALAERLGIPVQKLRYRALTNTAELGGQKVLLMKPQTYMNLSGEALIQAVRFYKLDPQDILVIHDDLDLPVGRIRIRAQGSAGGQKGMKNIIDHLHTQQIARIRVGIGKDPRIATVDYVLGKVPADQQTEYQQAINRAAEAARDAMTMPISEVMNRYNRHE